MNALTLLGGALLYATLLGLVIALVSRAGRGDDPPPDLNEEWAALDPDAYVGGAS